LAVLLALPAACQNQPPEAANSAPPANQAQAWTPPRSDLQVAEDIVRRRLGNARSLSFANARVYRGQRVPIVCGEVTQAGRLGRYIAVDGRAAWLELAGDLPPAQMDAAVREFCTGEGRPS
jgi:hypothetical protein